jgi:ribosomal protein S18 acetylase RimI-like enzyme
VKETFVIEPLAASYNRLAFSCGVEALDRYLQTQAGQNIRRRISNCFVAVPSDDNSSNTTTIIAGYYTLAAASIPLTDLPPEQAKRLPRYPVLPAALIGRLAVDHRYRKRSLGSALLFDAIKRAMPADPAIFALVVDAKDDAAAAFYRHFGFQFFASRPMSLFLPMAVCAKLLGL